MSLLLQGMNDALFVRGREFGEDRHVIDGLSQLRLRHLFDGRAEQDFIDR